MVGWFSLVIYDNSLYYDKLISSIIVSLLVLLLFLFYLCQSRVDQQSIHFTQTTDVTSPPVWSLYYIILCLNQTNIQCLLVYNQFLFLCIDLISLYQMKKTQRFECKAFWHVHVSDMASCVWMLDLTFTFMPKSSSPLQGRYITDKFSRWGFGFQKIRVIVRQKDGRKWQSPPVYWINQGRWLKRCTFTAYLWNVMFHQKKLDWLIQFMIAFYRGQSDTQRQMWWADRFNLVRGRSQPDILCHCYYQSGKISRIFRNFWNSGRKFKQLHKLQINVVEKKDELASLIRHIRTICPSTPFVWSREREVQAVTCIDQQLFRHTFITKVCHVTLCFGLLSVAR